MGPRQLAGAPALRISASRAYAGGAEPAVTRRDVQQWTRQSGARHGEATTKAGNASNLLPSRRAWACGTPRTRMGPSYCLPPLPFLHSLRTSSSNSAARGPGEWPGLQHVHSRHHAPTPDAGIPCVLPSSVTRFRRRPHRLSSAFHHPVEAADAGRQPPTAPNRPGRCGGRDAAGDGRSSRTPRTAQRATDKARSNSTSGADFQPSGRARRDPRRA